MIIFKINNERNIKYKKAIKKSIIETCKILKIKKATLSVSLINDKKMKILNKKYLKKDKTTDVLSFLIDKKNMLGDIYISGSTAIKNAEKLNHPYIEELSFLVIHSILHLTGYNHKKIEERKKMEKKEQKIFNSIWHN